MTVYAAEDTLTEELTTAFQEEVVQTGEENVETEIPVEETAGSSFSLEEQEYQVLLKIVEAEAGGEDTTGKMLVANVVMNRVRSGSFPNTVTEVVYQRSEGRAQFSPTADGRIDRVSVSPDTVEAVARVMNGEDPSAGALFFRSVHSNSETTFFIRCKEKEADASFFFLTGVVELHEKAKERERTWNYYIRVQEAAKKV